MRKFIFISLGLLCGNILLYAADNHDLVNLGFLSGTYTNSQYQAEGRPSKIVFAILEAKYIIVTWYNNASDTMPAGQEVNRLVETWLENNGTIWFKFQNAAPNVSGFSLSRLSPDHNTLEQAGSDKAFPKTLDEQTPWHSLWHRQ